MQRALLLGVVLLASASCSSPSFEVQPRYASSSLDGHLGVSSGSGSANNSPDDLGLGDDDTGFAARVDVAMGPQLTVLYAPSSFSGDGTLSGTVSGGGVTLPASTTVESELEYNTITAALTWDLVPSDTADVGLGVGIGAARIDGEVTSTDPVTPGSVDFEAAIPFPTLAIRAAFRAGPFELSGLVDGIVVRALSEEAHFIEFDLQAKLRFFHAAGLAGLVSIGWHSSEFDAELDDGSTDIDVDLRASGPYAGLSLGF
jgi:hypothetical protein